eukprot:PhM_4_TR472/c1_g1_i5/m.27482
MPSSAQRPSRRTSFPRPSTCTCPTTTPTTSGTSRTSSSTAFRVDDRTFLTWIAPNAFALTSWMTRNVAHRSNHLTATAGSKLSSVSLGCACILSRAMEVASLGDRRRLVLLEVFYSLVAVVSRLTLYYRHSVVTKMLDGECDLRARTDARSRAIFSRSNHTESVYDVAAFTTFMILRKTIEPDVLGDLEFIVTFVLCLSFQVLCHGVTFLLIAYFEQMCVSVMDVGVRGPRYFLRHLLFFCVTTLSGAVMIVPLLLTHMLEL